VALSRGERGSVLGLFGCVGVVIVTPPRWLAEGRDGTANHFSYALTWFGLALTLFGVFAAFAWQKR